MSAPSNGTGADSKRVKLGSLFSNLEVCPPDAIFGVKEKYMADKSPDKINLSIGAYRSEEGKPWVLPVVRTIESQMAADQTLNHEYLPLQGLKAFTEAATRLVLGESSLALTQNRAFGFQALSGTGALRLGAEFLRRVQSSNTVYIPKQTWFNHQGVFGSVGFPNICTYRYFKASTRGLDIEAMLEDLEQVPEKAVVILHACAHNPTGVDPSKEEWHRIIDVCKKRNLFPFFDCAYQGFVTGDPDVDAWAVREFVKEGFEMFIAQSFSKNFGLYNERAGQLCCVLNSPEAVLAVRSHLTFISRRLWSNCPNHGARVVATALNNPSLYQEWRDNLLTMTDRISQMRKELLQALQANGTPGQWGHIVKQNGMFTFTGLTEAQVEYMTTKHHIYLLKSGRINICGLTTSTIQYVADAMKDAVLTYPNTDSV